MVEPELFSQKGPINGLARTVCMSVPPQFAVCHVCMFKCVCAVLTNPRYEMR